MASFRPFALERWMSRWEQTVDVNLAESGVHPLTLEELLALAPGALDELLATPLGYPQVNGTPLLRERIAALYPGATADNVLVTVGAAEANYLISETLVAPGDSVAVMLPSYMQVPGAVENRGAKLRPFRLRAESGWALDLDELAAAVTPGTRLVAVCHPSNPTGHVLTPDERRAVVEAASRPGAWLLSDEVYRGSERVADEETPTLYGSYERVLAVGGLSKAYGLAGLRIGWVVGPRDAIDEVWARHEYVAISATALANRLAAVALSPDVRPRLLARSRGLVRGGWTVLESFLAKRPEVFAVTPPDATGVAFVACRLGVSTLELVERLREERRVLVVPGEHFGVPGRIRIAFGVPRATLEDGLERIAVAVDELA
jgi:aspartate/methionine/tyrosine aminotransferase